VCAFAREYVCEKTKDQERDSERVKVRKRKREGREKGESEGAREGERGRGRAAGHTTLQRNQDQFKKNEKIPAAPIASKISKANGN